MGYWRVGPIRAVLALSLVLVTVTAVAAWAFIPPGGIFEDDDGHEFEGEIEALAAAALTRGCGWYPMVYCPDDPVTRAELAAFLLRATDSADDLPDAAPVFSDVSRDAWYAAYAQRAVELELMQTSDGNRFRPEDPVTRAEAAIGLAAATATPTAAAVGLFTDVPIGLPWAASIEALHGAGVIAGCSSDPLAFCPEDELTRGQMAALLTRALGLEPLAPGPRPTTTTAPPPPDWDGVTTTTCPPG